MHRHIIYIINPISGTRTKKDLESFIAEETRKRGIDFDIFPSVASGDYSFLKSIISEKKTTDVVIGGGDGTINQVVNDLRKFDLNFGIIPCGSGNGLAFSAGIKRKPIDALKVIFEGKATPIDAFHVNGKFACMLCGIGFDAQVAYDFSLQKTRGLTTYVKQVVKNFFSAKPYEFEIKLPGKKIETSAYFISIANSNQFGNHFTIAPKASLDDGMLDVVILTDQNKLSLILQTLKQVAGKVKLQTGGVESEGRHVVYFQTKEVSILNKSSAPLHIDGDPAESAPKIEVRVEAGSFRLLKPGLRFKSLKV